MKDGTAQKCTQLTPKQLHAISILSAVPSQYDTIDEVAKKVGVSRRTIYNWTEINAFNSAVQKESNRNFKLLAGKVRSAHLKGILEHCNPTLIRLYYEITEGWTQKNDLENKEMMILGLPPSPFCDGTLKLKEKEERS